MTTTLQKRDNWTNHNLVVEFPENQNFQRAIKDISLIFRKYGLSYQQTKYVTILRTYAPAGG